MSNTPVGLLKIIEGKGGIECHLDDDGISHLLVYTKAHTADAGHNALAFVSGMREQTTTLAVHYVIGAHKSQCLEGGGEQIVLEVSAYDTEPDPDPAVFRDGLLGTLMQPLTVVTE